MMLEDPKGVERRMRELVKPILHPSWLEFEPAPQSIADHERWAEMLEILIDVLEDAQIGLRRKLVPADAVEDWSTPRKLLSPENETSFDLSVNPEGGLNIIARIEDKSFVEHGLSVEGVTTLIYTFTNLRMASPYR